MKKPKSANVSFLILILLFILSQTAFALSATINNDAVSTITQQSEFSAQSAPNPDNSSELSTISYDKSPLSDIEEIMEEKKLVRAMLKEEQLMASSDLQTMSIYTETQTVETDESAETEPEPTHEPEIKGVVRWINANQLNVRSEPNSSSKLVETIARGDRVTYYETIGEWARIITWHDRKGYILAKYLVDSAKEVDQVKAEVKTPSRGTGTSVPASSPQSSAGQSLAQQIVAYSKTLQGVKYVWGGNSTSGLDCSGLTKYVFSHFGIYVPRSSGDYWGFGTKVDRSNIKAGDIVLFDTDGGAADVSHVGIYLGDGNFIHASSTKGKVVIMNLNSYRGKYMGARRVIK